MPSDKLKTLAERVLREHCQLQETLTALQEFAKSSSCDITKSGTLSRNLRSLREQLKLHFEAEEVGELFEDIVRRLPSADKVVQTLKAQHKIFIDQIDSLIVRVEKVDRDLGGVREALSEFVESFRKHEGLENELLERAYCIDLGTND